MSVALLLPIGLAALAAWLLPLLVHLARRSEQTLVVFAALRWLQARPQPRRKRRFDERLLLAMRLLLVGLLALLLAEPVLTGRPDQRPRIAVAPGVDPAVLATLPAAAGARWLRLAPGLPPLDPATPGRAERGTALPAASLSSLLRELDATLPPGAALTVLVPPVLDGVDAERPQLGRAVEWRVVAAGPDAAVRPQATPAAPPRLMVRHAPERAASARYLRAAGVAWQAAARAALPADGRAGARPGSATVGPDAVPPKPDVAEAGTPLDATQRHLAWLVPGEVPAEVLAWVERGGSVLLDAQATLPTAPAGGDGTVGTAGGGPPATVVWRDQAGPLVVATRLGRGRVLQLRRALLPAQVPALLEADFPERLHALFAAPAPPPARVAAVDHAPVLGAAPAAETPRPLAPWLAWLVALVFVVERWLAHGPRRRKAA